jgi:large subunit ribosomal protein L24
MKADFSQSWKGSKQPRKQRKYLYNMPLHLKSNLVSSHLSAELRKKHGIRSIRVRKGDKVKVAVGQHKGKTGKIESVDIKNCKVTITGISSTKKDGSKSFYKFHPSNLTIEELDLSDKKRMGNQKKEVAKPKSAPKAAPKTVPKTAPKAEANAAQGTSAPSKEEKKEDKVEKK